MFSIRTASTANTKYIFGKVWYSSTKLGCNTKVVTTRSTIIFARSSNNSSLMFTVRRFTSPSPGTIRSTLTAMHSDLGLNLDLAQAHNSTSCYCNYSTFQLRLVLQTVMME